MNKRGPKPKKKVDIKWSSNFAYAVGLIATDGCVSKNGRSVTFVSKDKEQIINFMKALKVDVYIGRSFSGSSDTFAYRIQFSDVYFCDFLKSIGITSAKSKTIGKIVIPKRYFMDFVRGCFDGDGSIYSYWDKRWKSSFMFYVSFATASPLFVKWLKKSLKNNLGIIGNVKKDRKGSTFQLTYAKQESLILISKMYERNNNLSLSRKRLKIAKILAIVGKKV